MIVNVADFMTWFWNQTISIFTFMINSLSNITIYDGVSLLTFSLGIVIIGIVISILIASPKIGNKITERKIK